MADLIQVTDAGVATAVINEAKAHKVFQGEMPEAPDAKVAQANELVKLATQAINAGVKGVAVDAVYAAASQQADIPPTAAPGETEAPNPFAPPAPEPAVPAAAPAPTATPSIDDVIPGYDDLKVVDILEKLATLPPDQLALVKAYETSEGERPKILSFEPVVQPPPATAPTPAASPPVSAATVSFNAADPGMYGSVEPWDGYAKAKIDDIIAVIEGVVVNDTENAKQYLAHVWTYEQNNKERQRLFTKLKAIAENGVQSAPPAAAPDDPDVKPEPPFATEAIIDPSAVVPATMPAQSSVPASATPSDSVVAPLDGATQAAQQAIAAEGLPVPPEIEGEPPVLPGDFTALSDVEVRQYQSRFNACHARAHYLLSIAEGHSNDAKVVAEAAVRAFMRENEFVKGTTVAVIEAKAAEGPEVQHARRVQHEWSELARQYRALRDTYQFSCERLSREQTGRQGEQGTSRS